MVTLPAVRRTIDHLRRPFIQRLITLVVSALLAMSLISTTMLLTLPSSGHEVASSASGGIALPTHLDAARIQVGRQVHRRHSTTTEKGGSYDPNDVPANNAQYANRSLT
ncbi:MAG TPA: hypothetical protein VFV38_41205 [Ktedonobacteraceae bacterium]|nr:hypothetical protein [Ktedonobacteraceae bacterium]